MTAQTPPLSTAVAHNGRLAGKRVLITGTGGGQGAVAQELFCKHGAHVIGCDVRPGAAAATAAALSAQGLSAEGHDVDLADPSAARGWVANSISTLGGIDVLYNNASAAAVAPFSEMTLDQWRFTLANELEIVFTVTSAAWPALLENGGSIINIASSVGSIGLQAFGFAAHGAAKGGVLALTRQLAAEGAPHRVRVNAITPGFIATPGTSAIPQAARDFVARWVNLLDDPIEPIDVAYCALYLASDESRFVTGADSPSTPDQPQAARPDALGCRAGTHLVVTSVTTLSVPAGMLRASGAVSRRNLLAKGSGGV